MLTIKPVFKQLCPPILWDLMKFIINESLLRISNKTGMVDGPVRQKLDIYWDEAFIKVLDTWGEGTVWNEIQLLMINCQGRVLDIACGTGKCIYMLSDKFSRIKVYGCDISEKLIEKAVEKGIDMERFKVCDAARTGYDDKYFDYSYSIGSLEHFTEDGILSVIKECSRITKASSFHLVPISKSGKNKGWIKTREQAYFNNNLEWWLSKFNSYYKVVRVLGSAWQNDSQVGKWFICDKCR